MIKKILLTLLILIVLVVAGIIALVVFVDPNNFKGYISETVKDKTGYELTIDGDLRWHIWPQISILTDSVRFADEGAKVPLLTADNMRLDVALFPLFSKQLVVKNVLVKSAIINVSDDSKGQVAHNNKPTTTINQNQPNQEPKKASNWTFTLNKLDIVDSTVVYQKGKDIVNIRDIDISVEQNHDKHVAVDFSGRINRNQQDFTYSLHANINLADFPTNAIVELNKFNYEYKGFGEQAQRLKGQISATFNYQKSPLTLNSSDFVLTLNDNKITGKLKANLDKKPYIEGTFKANKFDLNPFLTTNKSANKVNSNQTSSQQPIAASTTDKGNELAFLNNFDAKFSLNINEILFKKLILNNFAINVINKDGVAKLDKVDLDVANGHINANGIANGKQATTLIKLATKVTDIDLGNLLAQLDVVNNFKGQFNANGNVATNSINADKMIASLSGNLAILVNNVRLDNINIQQIIQDTVANYWKKAVSNEEYQKYTSLHELSANATLMDGNMNLSAIKAASSSLDLNGSGRIGLVNQDLDINLQAKVLSGWNQASKTIQKLQGLSIPLRIHGKFNELHYQVNAEQLLNDVFNEKIQNGLDKIKERLNNNIKENPDDQSNHDASENKSDKQKVKDLLGDLIKKK